MRVNVSAIKSYQRNPRAWWYEYVLGRVPYSKAIALDIGTVAHKVLANHFLGMPMEVAVGGGEAIIHDIRRAALGLGQFDRADDLIEEWNSLREILGHWTPRFDVETVMVETMLEMDLDNGHTLYGTPDRVVRFADKLWHVQNRTLSGSTPIGPYLRAASLDLHELAYAALIQERYPDTPYGGTLYNIIRKLQLTSKTGKKLRDPEECFVQEFVPITGGNVSRALSGIVEIATEMELCIMLDTAPPHPCTDTCRLGRYGNALCPYFDVCVGEASIADDALYTDKTGSGT